MAKAKKRRAKKRPNVNKAERVAATPETLAKLRACPLKDMVHRGDMQPDQYEAALAIWDAHDSLVKKSKAGTLDLEKVRGAHGEIGDRKDQLIAVYFDWGGKLTQRFYLTADIVVGWIDDHEPSARMTNDVQRRMLVRACDLWIKVLGDFDKARREKANPPAILDKASA